MGIREIQDPEPKPTVPACLFRLVLVGLVIYVFLRSVGG